MVGIEVAGEGKIRSQNNLFLGNDYGIRSRGEVISTDSIFRDNHVGIKSRSGNTYSDSDDFYRNQIGVSANGGELYSYENRFQYSQSAIEMNNAFAHIAKVIAKNNDTAIHSKNSSSYLFGNELLQNRIGIDYNQGSRGVLRSSTVSGNSEADIRYDQNVVIDVIDTTANHLLNMAWSTPKNIRIDAEWITRRIINTSDIVMKSKYLIRLSKKISSWVKLPFEIYSILSLVATLLDAM